MIHVFVLNRVLPVEKPPGGVVREFRDKVLGWNLASYQSWGVISISEYAFRRQRVAVFLSMTHCSGRIRRAYAELLELPSDLAPQGPMSLAALYAVAGLAPSGAS